MPKTGFCRQAIIGRKSQKPAQNEHGIFCICNAMPSAVKKAHFPPCAVGRKYGTVSIDIKAERQLRLHVLVAQLDERIRVSIDIKAERQLRLSSLGGPIRLTGKVSIDIKAERQLRLPEVQD